MRRDDIRQEPVPFGATHPRRGRAVLSIGVGLLLFAAGVGLGVPHLARNGATTTALTGTASWVAGLSLMGLGARTMLRGRSVKVVVPAVVAGAVVAALLLLTVGQAVAATNVPTTELGASSPASRGLPYRDITLTAADGVDLAAWYIPSSNGAAVVLRHGAGSTRTDVLDHAAALAGDGYGVLLMDARGHGTSSGRAMDFGWYGDLDVRAGVDFLSAAPDVEPGRIGAVGLSMGGEEVIGAIAADPRIRVVVAEGASQRVPGDKEWLSDAYGVAGMVQELLDKATYAVTDLLTPADPPLPLRHGARLAAPRPILLITGGAVPDEERAARWIQAGSPDSVTIWVVPGAGHTEALRLDPDQWRRRVSAFLDASW